MKMYRPSLKHCPFCSGEAGYSDGCIFCYDCYAQMSAKTDLLTLVDLWNIRAQTLEDCAPVHKLKNERGAGRKRLLLEGEISEILSKRKNGMSIRKIADEMMVSVGLVHKLINERKNVG